MRRACSTIRRRARCGGRDIKKWPHLIWKRGQPEFYPIDQSRMRSAPGALRQSPCQWPAALRDAIAAAGRPAGVDVEKLGKSALRRRRAARPAAVGDRAARAVWTRSGRGIARGITLVMQCAERNLAIVEEVLARYPVDGFELQLNYCPYYFHPDEIAAGDGDYDRAGVGAGLCGYKKERSGTRIGPARARQIWMDAGAVGLEPLEWMRQGIVDAIVPEASGAAGSVGGISAPSSKRHTGRRVGSCRRYRVGSTATGSARGRSKWCGAGACNYWAQGVDGLYIAHWFGCWPYKADFYQKLREVPLPRDNGGQGQDLSNPQRGQARRHRRRLRRMSLIRYPLSWAKGQALQVGFARER